MLVLDEEVRVKLRRTPIVSSRAKTEKERERQNNKGGKGKRKRISEILHENIKKKKKKTDSGQQANEIRAPHKA